MHDEKKIKELENTVRFSNPNSLSNAIKQYAEHMKPIWVQQDRENGKRAWIIGNIISFEKPDYKSPVFDTEEVIINLINKKKMRMVMYRDDSTDSIKVILFFYFFKIKWNLSYNSLTEKSVKSRFTYRLFNILKT